jgi:hypothetical protein
MLKTRSSDGLPSLITALRNTSQYTLADLLSESIQIQPKQVALWQQQPATDSQVFKLANKHYQQARRSMGTQTQKSVDSEQQTTVFSQGGVRYKMWGGLVIAAVVAAAARLFYIQEKQFWMS